ncbi:hypothetical protein CK203_064923 [Vitis vinifera]|uniref:CCHC-type domain-containing protein n=1 Tax=Vitis vinifera TaxID=29760 RepID=A0A438FQ06_VITVI|nr:hypothetical protein CK203_064923 [Vitis vinifera]
MVFDVSKGVVCAFNIQQPVRVGGITMVRAARVSKKNLTALACSPFNCACYSFSLEAVPWWKIFKRYRRPPPFKLSVDVRSSPSWAVLDACIMSWRLGSVEPHIVYPLAAPSLRSIYDYYSAFLTLWHEYADLVTTNVPITTLSTIQTIHATTRRDQFLMKLHPEYESVRSSLLNRSSVPSLDICFGELLHEEQRLSTQAILEQSHGSSGTATVAYAAQGRDHLCILKNLQCFCCKEYGHIAATCPKKFCSYCKKKGHIIKECPHDSPSTACSVPAPPALDYCTPEMVQQMLISALSAMGFQGNNSTKLWYVDSGASNHMTNNPTALCHVRPYAGQSSIQTANGSSLPIAAIGDASSKFIDVFLALQLSTNLISVGQLVDNNCGVNFSGNGCVVQDQDRYSLSLECDSCKLGKSKTLPFPLHASRASHCFDLIHCDVWDLSRHYAQIPGGEYLSNEFQAFLASKGIIHQCSCPSTSQQNGVAEYKNHHLLDVSYIWSLPISAYLLSNLVMITFVFLVVYALFIYLLMSDINYLLNLFDVLSWDIICVKRDLFAMILHYIVHVFFRNVILFENQHFFPVSSSTVVLSSFEQQFSDLLPVSSRFQPGIVYTRRSRPQPLSVAHPISNPTTLQIQPVAAPPAPSVYRSSRVSVPPNRYGFPSSSSGNSISALNTALSNFDIPICYSHAAKHECWWQAMQEEIAALEVNHT